MVRIREWVWRLLGTLRGRRADADLEEELRLHLELAAEDMQRRLGPDADAARAARLRAGGLVQAMDTLRDQRGLPWLQDLAQDVRYGWRGLRRQPGFTLAACVTLALGVGANTAIFSLVHVLVWRDLPVRDPGALVEFTWQYPRDPPMNWLGVAAYEKYRDSTRTLAEVAGVTPVRVDADADGRTLNVEWVTSNFFTMLGVRPALGRVLDAPDFAADAPTAAVVSWQYWKRHFDLDASVLGSRIAIGETSAEIVGVANDDFGGLLTGYEADVWMPLPANPQARQARVMVVGRLRDGVALEQARAEMEVLDRPRIEELAAQDPQWGRVVLAAASARTGLSTPLHQQFGRPLTVVMALVALLLLLTCVNIGSLMLARAAARRHEMTLRASLGAGRFRLVRQVLAESLLLSALGSTLGVIGAWFAAPALIAIVTTGTRFPGPAPSLGLSVDATALWFSAGTAVLATLIFGLAPAIAAFNATPAGALRSAAATSPGSRRWTGGALVVAQVAVSLVLVSVAGLCARHLSNLRDRDLGFDRSSVLVIAIDPGGHGRDRLTQLYKEALQRLESMPGVRSATISGTTPMSGGAASRFVTAEGFEEPYSDRRRLALNTVAPRYFETLRTPLLAGRDFAPADENGPLTAIVNQAAARHYFAGRDPIGKRVWLEGDGRPYEIVGVVADAKYSDIRGPAPQTVYLDAFQQSRLPSQFVVRTSGSPAAAAASLRQVLEDVVPGASIRKLTTLAAQIDETVVPERLVATMSGFFAGLGMLLAAVGLYGLLAYSVTRRAAEIGVRVAVGATPRDIIRMVLTSALTLAGAGLAIGVPLAAWAMHVTASLLPSVARESTLPGAADLAVIVAVALLAAYAPARRALSIEPNRALRSE